MDTEQENKSFVSRFDYLPETSIFRGKVTGLLYVWRGRSSINIHLEEEDTRYGIAPYVGDEIDIFTLYGDDKGGPPSFDQVMEAINEREEEAEDYFE